MIISVANQKGGVGKTTTVVNLAHWFSLVGYRVLVIDMDVQGHAGVALGCGKADSLFRLLVDGVTVDQVKVEARARLDLVRSNKRAEMVKVYLSSHGAPAMEIASALQRAAAGYDLVFVDLAPGSDALHVGALMASDYYLVPASMEFLALDGVVEVIGSVASLGQYDWVEPPALIGVVPTRYDRVATDIRDNVQRLGEAVGKDLVLPPVPKDVRLPESTARGLTIWEYAGTSSGAVGYQNGSLVRNSQGKTGGYLHLAEIVKAFVRL